MKRKRRQDCSIQTSEEQRVKSLLFSPWGGCLIDPPSNCQHKFHPNPPDGSTWVDIGNCQRHSCAKECSLFMWFQRATPKERLKRQIDHSVNIKVEYYPDMGLMPKEETKEDIPQKQQRRRRKQ
jgi:hypothetical protein